MYHHWPGICFWRHCSRHIDYRHSNINTYRQNRTSQSRRAEGLCERSCESGVLLLPTAHFQRVGRVGGGVERDHGWAPMRFIEDGDVTSENTQPSQNGGRREGKRGVNRGWRESGILHVNRCKYVCMWQQCKYSLIWLFASSSLNVIPSFPEGAALCGNVHTSLNSSNYVPSQSQTSL